MGSADLTHAVRMWGTLAAVALSIQAVYTSLAPLLARDAGSCICCNEPVLTLTIAGHAGLKLKSL